MSSIYLSNAIFMMIILTIIFLRIRYYITWSPSKKYTMIFIGMVELYVLMDALFMKELLGKSGNFLQFKLVVFFFYLVYVIMPYVWHLFMQSYMGINRSKKQRFAEMIPFILLVLMVLLSVPTGIVWRFSRNRTYIRGTFFGVFAVLNLFYYVYTFAQTFFILFMNNTKGVRYLIKSALFSAVPLIGILANTYIIPLYGAYPFQPYCLVIGALLSYLFMVEHQQDQMEFEHRKRLSKALELEKESTRKAKVAGEVKNAFLANMSHDIRTPMNAIIGFSDIIAEHPDDEEIVKNAISKIQASGEILLKIINDVLDLSKIESGKAENVETVTDLKQMEENLKMMLEYSIQKGMIDFKVEDQIENPLVWCDVTKLQQVLVNVLNNAVKFTPAGGTITFSCVQRMIAPGFAEYKFTIKDTGIGMTEEFQKHAFEAFERERTSTESKTEGTGLGLAIVKKLVDLMHGNVIIQSNSGQGTKIQISLPLRIATENQLHQSDKAKEYKIGLDGMHVLLVEDNELNAEIAMEVLKNKGVLVNWVPDGCACVEEIQDKEAGTYQFILMDVQMPRMNGYEATQKIRQLADVKKAQIPIIAMTANAFEEDRKHALDAGMDGFIMKPFRVGDYIISPSGEGKVSMVGLVYTTILTTDNKTITIPNGTLSNSTVTNVTAMDKRMLELKVGIAYEADIRTAKAVLERVYREHPMVKKEEDIKVFVDSLGDSSVVLGIRGWVETSDYWQTRWDILERIKLSFDEAGIEIPYNKMDVHLKQ